MLLTAMSDHGHSHYPMQMFPSSQQNYFTFKTTELLISYVCSEINNELHDAIVSYGKIVPYAYRGVPVDKVCADLSGPNTSDLSFKKVKNWRFGIPFQPPI